MRLTLMLALVLLALPARAQAPTLSAAHATALRELDLKLENAALRLQLIQLERQATIERIERETNATLARSPEGVWSLTPRETSKP